MKIWFTSDLHLGHSNIIHYCSRPFLDVHDMNKTLINNWNSVVQAKDLVYILGDLCIGSDKSSISMVKRLQGKKILISGNHDKKLCKKKEYASLFEYISPLEEIKIQDQEAKGGSQMIVLCHYAMRHWNKSHYGSWQLHGHSHGTLPPIDHLLQIDVGVDANGYFPLSYENIKEKMKNKVFTPILEYKKTV